MQRLYVLRNQHNLEENILAYYVFALILAHLQKNSLLQLCAHGGIRISKKVFVHSHGYQMFLKCLVLRAVMSK